MKSLVIGLLLSLSSFAFAAPSSTVKLNVKNEELLTIIEIYAKASGQKFVIDPSVRGKISILNQEPVTIEEAFNQISSALAINGFAISKQGDVMVIRSARNIQRDLVEVTTELPALKPERMVTWIATVKNIPATSVNRDLRIFPSKDGEMNLNVSGNQIIFTDYVSNLHRIAEILKEIDKPITATTAKFMADEKKENEARHKHRAQQEAPPTPPAPTKPKTN